MAQAPCQVDQGAVSKLMDLEDTIIDVGDAIDVILKDIDAEGVTEAWGGVRGDSGPGHSLQDTGPHGSQVPLTQHVPKQTLLNLFLLQWPLLAERPISPGLLGSGSTSAPFPHIC